METHKEKPIQAQAFETYLELKSNNYTTHKSINMVAEEYDYTPRQVWKWYKWFDWKHREQERNKEIQRIIENKHNQIIAKNKSNYLTITHTLLEDYINEGIPAKISTIKDLETVVKLSLLLQGEPTSITKEENMQIDYTDQIKRM